MRCEYCESRGHNHDEIVALCKSSPYWAGLLLAEFDWLNNDLHQSIADWFTERLMAGKRHFIIMTPRNHLKTTLFGVSVMLWRIINNPDERILYVMASSENAEKTMQVVQDTLMYSEPLAHFFPEVVLNPNAPRTTANKGYLKIPRTVRAREGTVEARGIDSRITGGHFTWHIFDDLIDEKMVVSQPALQEIAKKLVELSDAMFTDQDKDIELIIGTRWPGIFYKWLLEESGLVDEYETLNLGCYVDDRYADFLASIGKKTTLHMGDPIWPERFTHKILEKIKKKAGPFGFAHQWLNIETTEHDARFNRDDFRYFRFNEKLDGVEIVDEEGTVTYNKRFSGLKITMTIDLATGEGSHTDASAITVCGYDQRTGKVFVLETWSDRALPISVINKVIEMAKRWRPIAVSPEDVSYQKTMKHFLKQEMQRKGVSFRIRPVKPGNIAKGARIIDALQPFVANNQVHFHPQQRKLMRELAEIRVVDGKIVGKSPNLADSLSYHAGNWKIALPGVDKNDDDDEDIVDIDSFVKPTTRAYGLECST